MSPRTGPDDLETREISGPVGIQIPDRTARSMVTILTALLRFAARSMVTILTALLRFAL